MIKKMSQYDSEVIEKYRHLLKKDPRSQVFAPLAEAYRETGQIVLAEKIAREGLKHNPQFAAGHLVLGKIFKDQKKLTEALEAVQKALQFSPENLLAHQIEGDLLIELKRPQEALRSFKMVLLLNPLSSKAKKIVSKLESLSASEYTDDVFSMMKLKDVSFQPPPDKNPDSPEVEKSSTASSTASLQRSLSLLDAFLVRNDLAMANKVLSKAREDLGPHEELDRRERILKSRTQSSLLAPLQADQPEKIAPLASREKQIRQKKLQILKRMLRVIDEKRVL